MNPKLPSKNLSEHLHRLHTFTQGAEEKLRIALAKTEQMGIEAEEANARAKSDRDIDLKECADIYAELFVMIRLVVLGNEELQEIFEASLANKVANAETLARNWELLNTVDPRLIATTITQVQDQETMNGSITIIDRRGGDGLERLRWLSEALKRNGY